MIRNIFTVFFLAVVMGLSSELSAQEFSGLDKSPADISYYRPERGAAPLIKVVYSRPQLKGRQIGVDLAPFGEVWRTGANEATEVHLYQDMMLGDQTVKAGTYSLFSIPGKDEWTIILNSDTDVWGAYNYDESKDVVRFNVPAGNDSKSLDAFSIAFEPTQEGANMHMGWGTTRVSVPFKAVQ
ncbi:DUF2911 domain-containing protein [Robertkochia flava]|uniref:DUF2911 domain-containing protein n=1 Tax=Robertkochia flava TaxID=3447986 RepID=UPI001CCA88F0|nr:DUF2911 domain-containing protein [Robertkochia marina]